MKILVVSKRPRGWGVRKSGALRCQKRFLCKCDAVGFAARWAWRLGCAMYVMTTAGNVQARMDARDITTADLSYLRNPKPKESR